jgi:chemotaxis protein CheC
MILPGKYVGQPREKGSANVGDYEFSLDDKQLTALEKVGEVGAEMAALSLSHIIKCKFELAATSIQILPYQDVPDMLGGAESEVLGVNLAIDGSAKGKMLFVIALEDAHKMTARIFNPESAMDTSSPQVREGLEMVGNVLATSFLNGLCGSTKLPLFSGRVQTIIDMAGAISSQMLAEASQYSDRILMFNLHFKWADFEAAPHCIMVLQPESMAIILKSLGV